MRTKISAFFAGLVVFACLMPVASANAAKFEGKVVYTFCSKAHCADGQAPLSYAGLIAVDGLLYGTTAAGGRGPSVCSIYGSCYSPGTVFSLDPNTGIEKVLYTFCRQRKCVDGLAPAAGLLYTNGLLYGTTTSGGRQDCDSGCGVVFSLDPNTGAEKTLYSFCQKENCADGARPYTGLIDVSGTLYGTTWGGGGQYCTNRYCGTVFSLDPSTGVEKALYSFCNEASCADGRSLIAGLVSVNGVLYGTTQSGGVTDCRDTLGCGTVFAIDPNTGTQRVIHTFCSRVHCKDGALPTSNLIDVDGTLYGTTQFGGSHPCQNMPTGCGTVFALDPNTGAETALYDFAFHSGKDDTRPAAGLVSMNGKLYGTGVNAAFSVDPATGKGAMIWPYCGGCDYASGLTVLNGKLYGTMEFDSASNNGIVFELEKAK